MAGIVRQHGHHLREQAGGYRLFLLRQNTCSAHYGSACGRHETALRRAVRRLGLQRHSGIRLSKCRHCRLYRRRHRSRRDAGRAGRHRKSGRLRCAHRQALGPGYRFRQAGRRQGGASAGYCHGHRCRRSALPEKPDPARRQQNGGGAAGNHRLRTDALYRQGHYDGGRCAQSTAGRCKRHRGVESRRSRIGWLSRHGGGPAPNCRGCRRTDDDSC